MKVKIIILTTILLTLFLMFSPITNATLTEAATDTTYGDDTNHGFEEAILEILKEKEIITQEKYQELSYRLKIEDQSINEALLDLLREKDIVSQEKYVALREKARAPEQPQHNLSKKETAPNPAAHLAVQEVQQEGERQKAEIKQAGDEAVEKVADAGKINLPEWVKKIDIYGDLRLRHDTQWRSEDNDKYKRNRERFRLRLGMKADVTETTEVGVRFASGSGFQNTTNQSFDDHARGKHIFIDRAYGKWEPAKFLTIVGGKFRNPLFTAPLVWDPDVNPEGLYESFKFDITDRVNIFTNFGQWFVEELNKKDSSTDPTLFTYQLGSKIKLSDTMKLDLALAYYDYTHMDDLEWEPGILKDNDDFLGYNQRHGQQMIFDSDGNLVNEFSCLEVDAKLTIKDVLPWPLTIFGGYLKNIDADIDELIAKGVDTGDSDPADLLSYGGDDRDTGWTCGLSLGNKKKKGDWYVKYFYQELEDYAFPAVFVDSDFHGGGTNNKGHYIQGRYFLNDFIQVRATGYFTEREDESKDGKKDEDRLQVDLVFSF